MSNLNTPGNAGFNQYPPGPHSGVPTDPHAHVAPDSLDREIRTIMRSRWAKWVGVSLLCVVLAIGIYMSIT